MKIRPVRLTPLSPEETYFLYSGENCQTSPALHIFTLMDGERIAFPHMQGVPGWAGLVDKAGLIH